MSKRSTTAVQRAQAKREQLRADGDRLLRDAILKAQADGATLREIGVALSLSHVRVHQILREGES